MILEQTDAGILLAVVTGLTAIVVAWLRTVAWPEWVKFLTAVAFSGVAGALVAFTGGQLRADASILSNLALVYTAGRVFYFAAFQALGLERILLPKAALATAARAQVDIAVAAFTNEQARTINDPRSLPSLQVDTNVVNRI